jgi:hypothetical protein
MWPATFEQRLASWNQLRQTCTDQPTDQCLSAVNVWWHATPWTPYYLHWDDEHSWPDPWQLLHDNIYCGLARALGIVYTIVLLERSDLVDASILQTENDNLVQICQGKYILNWEPHTIVNIITEPSKLARRITQQQLEQKIR